MRPQSRGSLVQLDGSYMFFADGGRSAPTTLANEWKRPTTTRGGSYAQLASMMHLNGFHEQMGELRDAMQDHGTVTNLDAELEDSFSSEDESAEPDSGLDLEAAPPSQRDSAPEAGDGSADLEARLRALFTSIDVDGNGTLSREELSTKLRQDTEIQTLVDSAGKSSMYLFEQLDADSDGSITVEEFLKLCVPYPDEDEDEEDDEAEQEEQEEEKVEEEQEEEDGDADSLRIAATAVSKLFVRRLFDRSVQKAVHLPHLRSVDWGSAPQEDPEQAQEEAAAVRIQAMHRGNAARKRQPAEEEQEEELTVESLLRQSSEVMHHVDAAKKRMSDHSVDNEQLDNETKQGWVRRRSQDLVGQGMSAEAADRFAAAADQHTALMQAAQQRGADSGEYLRPLPIPAAMLPRPPADDDNGDEDPPMERSESSAQAHVGMRKKASLWSKLRKKRRATGAAATSAKRAPEAGLHLQLFATAVAGAPGSEARCAIVTLELFEVSPIFSSAGASVCAKLRTISSEEGSSSSEPVLLSKSGAILRPSDNECEIAVEDVDACHLELQVCDSESAHAAELGRAWLPLRNVLGASVEGRIVDLWLPSPAPPPVVAVTMRGSSQDEELQVTLHTADHLAESGGEAVDAIVEGRLVVTGAARGKAEERYVFMSANSDTATWEEKFAIPTVDMQTFASQANSKQISVRFTVYDKTLVADRRLCEFDWPLPAGLVVEREPETRRLNPRPNEQEFQRIVTSVGKSQRAWREQIVERIDAIAAFKAIDTNGNGLLDSEELARVAYVMDGGEIMSSKEVAAAEADIATELRADGGRGLMHHNWRGQGEDLSGVEFDQFFAWISRKRTPFSLPPTHAAALTVALAQADRAASWRDARVRPGMAVPSNVIFLVNSQMIIVPVNSSQRRARLAVNAFPFGHRLRLLLRQSHTQPPNEGQHNHRAPLHIMNKDAVRRRPWLCARQGVHAPRSTAWKGPRPQVRARWGRQLSPAPSRWAHSQRGCALPASVAAQARCLAAPRPCPHPEPTGGSQLPRRS